MPTERKTTEIIAIFTMAASVLLGFAYWAPSSATGIIGVACKWLGFGAIGTMASLLPVVLFGLALDTLFDRHYIPANARRGLILVIFLCLSILVSTFSLDQQLFTTATAITKSGQTTNSAVRSIVVLTQSGLQPALISHSTVWTGGLIGGAVSLGLQALLGKAGTVIVLLANIGALAVLLFNASIAHLFSRTAAGIRVGSSRLLRFKPREEDLVETRVIAGSAKDRISDLISGEFFPEEEMPDHNYRDKSFAESWLGKASAFVRKLWNRSSYDELAEDEDWQDLAEDYDGTLEQYSDNYADGETPVLSAETEAEYSHSYSAEEENETEYTQPEIPNYNSLLAPRRVKPQEQASQTPDFDPRLSLQLPYTLPEATLEFPEGDWLLDADTYLQVRRQRAEQAIASHQQTLEEKLNVAQHPMTKSRDTYRQIQGSYQPASLTTEVDLPLSTRIHQGLTVGRVAADGVKQIKEPEQEVPIANDIPSASAHTDVVNQQMPRQEVGALTTTQEAGAERAVIRNTPAHDSVAKPVEYKEEQVQTTSSTKNIERTDIDHEVLDRNKWQDRTQDKVEPTLKQQLASVSQRVQTSLTDQYVAPPLEFLNPEPTTNSAVDEAKFQAMGVQLEKTLNSFGVDAKVINYTSGPTITRFEVKPGLGVKVSKIINLSDDIALALAALGVRIEAPIPGKSAIGIEIPNAKTQPVLLSGLIKEDSFKHRSGLTAALGRDIAGNPIYCDLSAMPHLLIAGATGSGKSVCINTILLSLLYSVGPEDLRILMIDPKVVELSVYNGIPHLLQPVVTDPKKAYGVLNWAVLEMTDRYNKFAENNVRDFKSYNRLIEQGQLGPGVKKLPYILVIIDELSDLMATAANEVESAIQRLTALARAAGIHLIIATQRPSVDVITGVIKSNIPSRIAFAVASQVDSRTIIDMQGAEKLLGKGDMLYAPNSAPKPIRGQGAFVTDAEVERVVTYLKSTYPHDYDETVGQLIESAANAKVGSAFGGSGGKDDAEDELLDEAVRLVISAGYASTSMLQRRLSVGFPRASRIIDQLYEHGYIGPFEGSKPRKVTITMEEYLASQEGN